MLLPPHQVEKVPRGTWFPPFLCLAIVRLLFKPFGKLFLLDRQNNIIFINVQNIT